MTTKRQEQEALNQIRGILESLDKDSWLNWAFDGCVEMAQRNLDEDSANSMMEQRDNAREQVEDLESKLEDKKESVKELREILKETREHEHRLVDKLNDFEATNDSLWEQVVGLQDKADEQAQTIIELKAKLYDHMMKEAERGE